MDDKTDGGNEANAAVDSADDNEYHEDNNRVDKDLGIMTRMMKVYTLVHILISGTGRVKNLQSKL